MKNWMLVMPGFMPGIRDLGASKTWMAGTTLAVVLDDRSPGRDKKIATGEIGAGDGIRTHDPDLGKVVLYP
jgi:hypothetical protein